MRKRIIIGCIVSGGLLFFILSFAARSSGKPVGDRRSKTICCESHIPSRFAAAVLPFSSMAVPGKTPVVRKPEEAAAPVAHPGMVWIGGGAFLMGADNKQALEDEYPKHKVTVDGFWMDRTEVTNEQFSGFVRATGYMTTAERKPDWAVLKQQLPPGTPKPDESVLVAASLVFSPPDHAISLDDYSQWWNWKKGADWRHPHGP